MCIRDREGSFQVKEVEVAQKGAKKTKENLFRDAYLDLDLIECSEDRIDKKNETCRDSKGHGVSQGREQTHDEHDETKFTSAQAETVATAIEDGSSLELSSDISSNGAFSWPDSVDEECSNYLSEFSFNDEGTLDHH